MPIHWRVRADHDIPRTSVRDFVGSLLDVWRARGQVSRTNSPDYY
jgi:hypothetical protein